MQSGLIFKSNEHLVDILSFRVNIGQIQWFQFSSYIELTLVSVLHLVLKRHIWSLWHLSQGCCVQY